MSSGTLYVIPTPIGNLEDITLRALRILKEVDLIICEDTRQTAKLLNHFQIQKPTISFFTHNQYKRIPQITGYLNSGKNIGLVSDSGTPCISDPGQALVEACRAQNINVISLPGANAAVTALAGSGMVCGNFVFMGFLKRKSGKIKKELESFKNVNASLIIYESPYRVKKTLALCLEVFGANTAVVLARELTKKFEEYITGNISEVIEKISSRQLLGEFVIIIDNNISKTNDVA